MSISYQKAGHDTTAPERAPAKIPQPVASARRFPATGSESIAKAPASNPATVRGRLTIGTNSQERDREPISRRLRRVGADRFATVGREV